MTEQISSKVRSSQLGIHPRLEACVKRHLEHSWQQPVHEPTAKAFSRIRGWIRDDPRPLVLDSGCGTGESSRALSEHHPETWVVAVDQSLSRLRKAVKADYTIASVIKKRLKDGKLTVWHLKSVIFSKKI